MLQLFDLNKVKVAGLVKYSNLRIESILSTGDSILSFNYPTINEFKNLIQEECYIRTKDNEYIIKEINILNEYLNVTCLLNIEELESKVWEHFNTELVTIEQTLNLAFAGTGWTIGRCTISKKRTIKLTNCNSWEITKECKKVFRVDYKFDSINKKIYIFEELGEDKGSYFIEDLNLKSLEVKSNSYDFFTRIIPIGKDGLTIESINNGKRYLENFQYVDKIKTFYWKDERYTIQESLKEDAEYKLNEVSKPFKAYSTEIIDLANINEKYKNILNYDLGDTITLLSKTKKLKEKQRIVKIIKYPEEPFKNSCELANTVLRFEDIQQDLQNATNVIDNITTDNGTIDGSTIDSINKEQIKNFDVEVGKVVNLEAVNAKIENLVVNKADINSLNAVIANIGELYVTKAEITDLAVINANIGNLEANKADIIELNAVTAKIDILEATTGKIQDLVNGNLSSENIQTGGITGDRLNMNTVFINDANIKNINATKINGGEIDVNKVKIKSNDGAIEIAGATQQFKDKNNKVRVQIGKDTKGDFNFILRGEDGNSILIDHTGIKENALSDNLIKENMISEDAIGEKQINYTSFSTGFNKDTNTTKIKATKVILDNQNQSLDVAFTSLKNQADSTKSETESNTTKINVQQGQINTAIANTKIVKDEKEILLKDDYNTTVATVSSIKNTISSHTTQIDTHTGEIIKVESKTNLLERDLNSMSNKIIATESIVNNHATEIDKNKDDIFTVNTEVVTTKNKISGIEQNLDNITQTVSSVEDLTASIDGKIIAHESRLNNVELKTTDKFIINTVQSSINQAKTEAINSSNNTTDGKLNNYTTTSQFTQFKQISENFQFKVSSTINQVNLIENGNLRGKDNTNAWSLQPDLFWTKVGDNVGIGCAYGGQTERIVTSNVINLKNTGRVLSLSARVEAERHTYGAQVYLIGSTTTHFQYDWALEALTFSNMEGMVTKSYENIIIPNHIKYLWVRLDYEGWNGDRDYRYVYIDFINLVKGEKAFAERGLDGTGIVEGATTITADGVQCDFEDGTYAKMGRDGFCYYTQGMKNPYKYINFTTKISAVRNGTWRNIILPSCFQWKNINSDFVVQTWAGAVDSNAFANKQKDAIRNLFIEIGGWNSSTRELSVRPCMQKIGVATHTHWGWDSNTTTSGNTIGEGAIDIIILAQM